MFRLLALLAAIAGAGLLAWYCYIALSWHSTDPGPGLLVENPDQVFEQHPTGTSVVIFRIHNPSDRVYGLVNAQDGCGTNCCFYPKQTGPRKIGPGETVEVVGEMRILRPGPFEYRANLYLNEDGLRVVPYTIRGNAVAAGGLPDAKAKP
jgi:hypothetical protein